MRKIPAFLSKKAVAVFFLLLLPLQAWGIDKQSIQVITGWGEASLDNKKDYRVAPFFVDINFQPSLNTEQFFNKYLKANLNLIYEPFLNFVYSPDRNIEIGNNFLVKLSFLKSSEARPYIKLGVGLIYLTQHTRQQATQLNFNELGALGIDYFFTKDAALTIEYRMRHLSNAGIKHPNRGIDTRFLLLGLLWRF